MAGDEEQLLVEESTVPVISSSDLSGTDVRLAHFLLPRADGGYPPALPSPPRNAGPILDDGIKVKFKGWAEAEPRGLWRRWVSKLRPRYESRWRKVGILDAVLATTFQVRRDEGMLLQLAAMWSAETNTFVFPWGEATVTLEDVAVLAGLPLLGRPVWPPPHKEDVNALVVVLSTLHHRKGQQPNHSAWAEHFLERPPEEEAADDGEAARLLEHGAFMAMWLSLFVLPDPPFDVLRMEVLPIAARLARGRCNALAPAALARIYSDLSRLNRYVNYDKIMRYEPLVCWAPLHILQLWVWERFPELRPEMATTLPRPWAARWHNVHKAMDPSYVHAVFMSPREFEWRPYGTNSFAPSPENGCSLVHGQEEDRDTATNNQLLSFARCLRACELVGVRCIEHYRPHRVARQLGFDQDVPAPVARCNSDWEKAWATYNMEPSDFSFIVPQFSLAVTTEYARWWKPYSSQCATAVSNAAKLKKIHASVSQREIKIEVLYDANSGKKQHGHQVLDTWKTSQTRNKAIEAAPIVTVQSTPGDIMVIRDAKFEELLGKEDDVGAIHLRSSQFETKTSSSLQGPNVETQLVSRRNNKQSNPIFKEVKLQSNSIDDLATAPNGSNLRQGPAQPTNVTIVQPGVNLLEGPTEEVQARVITGEIDNRDKPRKEHIAAMERNEKANEDASASNQEPECQMEDCRVVNRKRSGNNNVPSSSLIDLNTELPTAVVSTNTLYYQNLFGWVKDAQDYARGSRVNQEAYLPRREVGTREITEEASAARKAEKIELQKQIDRLKEEIAAEEVQLRNAKT